MSRRSEAVLETRPYLDQVKSWPTSGRHILAQYDDESIVVYQAYRPTIAEFAVRHQRFGGEFKLTRMSWIKPNFLWMMYRCGWASKEGQEHVLAVRLRREFFDRVLRLAVPSGFHKGRYSTAAEWKEALHSSEVRLQWDPDHSPAGGKVERRAIQLGLRGSILKEYAQEALIEGAGHHRIRPRTVWTGSLAVPRTRDTDGEGVPSRRRRDCGSGRPRQSTLRRILRSGRQLLRPATLDKHLTFELQHGILETKNQLLALVSFMLSNTTDFKRQLAHRLRQPLDLLLEILNIVFVGLCVPCQVE